MQDQGLPGSEMPRQIDESIAAGTGVLELTAHLGKFRLLNITICSGSLGEYSFFFFLTIGQFEWCGLILRRLFSMIFFLTLLSLVV